MKHDPSTENSSDALDDVITLLRAEIMAPTTADDEPQASEVEIESLAAIVADLSSSAFSAEVQQFVDGLVDWQSLPSPEARAKLVATADAALLQRQMARGPVPRLLSFERVRQAVPLADLVNAVGIDDDAVRAVEAGTRPITFCEPDGFVRWVRALHISTADALRSLHVSLSKPAAGPALAGKEEFLNPSEDGQRYYDEVKGLLESAAE